MKPELDYILAPLSLVSFSECSCKYEIKLVTTFILSPRSCSGTPRFRFTIRRLNKVTSCYCVLRRRLHYELIFKGNLFGTPVPDAKKNCVTAPHQGRPVQCKHRVNIFLTSHVNGRTNLLDRIALRPELIDRFNATNQTRCSHYIGGDIEVEVRGNGSNPEVVIITSVSNNAPLNEPISLPLNGFGRMISFN